MRVQLFVKHDQDGLLAELKILRSVVVSRELRNKMLAVIFEASEDKMWRIIFFVRLFIQSKISIRLNGDHQQMRLDLPKRLDEAIAKVFLYLELNVGLVQSL